MIVLGIAPGIKNLAYCALSYDGTGPPRVPQFGADLLKGIRLNGAATFEELRKKATAHVRILEVIFERFPPIVVAVGPAARNEPELATEAARFVVRLAVRALSEKGLPVKLEEWHTREELLEVLGVSTWRDVPKHRIGNYATKSKLKKPGVELAAATALAAATRLPSAGHKRF